MKHFKDTEIICKCKICNSEIESQIEDMNPLILDKIDKYREIKGTPVTVTSGLRCMAHPETKKWLAKNMDLGLEWNNHYSGHAIDFWHEKMYNDELISSIQAGATFQELIDAFEDIAILHEQLGIERIGVHKNFIHIDVHPHKEKALWLY